MGKKENIMEELVREAGYAQRSLSRDLLMETYGKAKMARQFDAISSQEFREISHMTVCFMNTHARELECGEKTAENKEEIVTMLKYLLNATRERECIRDLVLDGGQDSVDIFFNNGYRKTVNIEGDSGLAVIRDVLDALS